MSALARASLYGSRAIGVLLLPGLTKAPPGYAQSHTSTVGADRSRAIHLLQRTTYGPRPQDIEAVLSTGVAGWLDLQLHPDRIDDAALDLLLAGVPIATMSFTDLLGQFPPGQVLRPLRELAQNDSLPRSQRRKLRQELGERNPRKILTDMTSARLLRAVHSERQLEEMMTAFWFDHFNVFWGKGAARWMVSDYERTAIRPHVFGKFEDMVLATARHPAMLFYLDNFQSVAPDSSLQARERRDGVTRRFAGMNPRARDRARERMAQARQQRQRRPGLNENYARELMELHTLGVDGGYSQADVIAVARILTGWTFQQPGNRMDMRQAQASFEDGRIVLPDVDYREAYRFRFRSQLHDAGEKTVMGHTFERGGGEDEGVELIGTLARHPSTARHIAIQLVTRFVADEPPTALVDHLAAVFLATGGDLRKVTRALFTSEAFYQADALCNRIKSPFLLVASTLRLTYGHMPNAQVLNEPLRSLGEAPYLAEPPTGYSETSAQWASSGAMLARINFATSYVAGDLPGVGPDGERLFAEIREVGEDGLTGLVSALLPGVDPTDLTNVIHDDLRENPPDRQDEGGVRALSLILGSPEFQRH